MFPTFFLSSFLPKTRSGYIISLEEAARRVLGVLSFFRCRVLHFFFPRVARSLQSAQRELRDASRTADSKTTRQRALELARARKAYDSARAEMHSGDALRTLEDGKRERRALRALGLIDGRFLRHSARLRVLNIVLSNPSSRIYLLPSEVYKIIAGFITMTDDEAQIALSHAPTLTLCKVAPVAPPAFDPALYGLDLLMM